MACICEIGTNKHVILSEAKDLKLRILRSFAVFAVQDDVSRFVIYTPPGAQFVHVIRTNVSFSPLTQEDRLARAYLPDGFGDRMTFAVR